MPQMPNTKLLQAFEATARRCSISDAAKEMFITQSALSRQIKALEETLNLALFTRKKNRLILTDVGRTLYSVIEKNLGEIAACTAQIQGGVRRIIVKSPPSIAPCWLAPRLSDFYKKHRCFVSLYTNSQPYSVLMPNYDIEIVYSECNELLNEQLVLFPEETQPACSPEVYDYIQQHGIDSVPMLHTLTATVTIPYWEYWIKENKNSQFIPNVYSRLVGMEFSTQEQAVNAAIGGTGVVMIEPFLFSGSFEKKELVALGEAVKTPFHYWVHIKDRGEEKNELIHLFYEWLREQTAPCRQNE